MGMGYLQLFYLGIPDSDIVYSQIDGDIYSHYPEW
jgi:hypothetical protein